MGDVVLCGVIGHQSQLRSGHFCAAYASCKTVPPLVQVVPVTVIPVTATQIMAYNQLKMYITTSTLGPFKPGYLF